MKTLKNALAEVNIILPTRLEIKEMLLNEISVSGKYQNQELIKYVVDAVYDEIEYAIQNNLDEWEK